MDVKRNQRISALAAAAAAMALGAAPALAGTTVEYLTNGSFENTGGAQAEGWGGLTYYAGGCGRSRVGPSRPAAST